MVPSRPHDRGRALPRRDRRLAPVRALAVRRPRARGLGAGAVRPHPRRVRPRVRRDLVGRRDHRAPARRRRAAAAPSWCWSSPTRSRSWSCGELAASALFGARFRENAARALLLPRAYPGKRTPLWQQRLKAQSLLEVAKRYGQFPIVLETYRECLRDVLDLPGLEELLRGLHTRELSLVEVETQRASPFASSLLFDYVATYMYEGDTPNAERRAAALSLDRDLLRELLGQEELRDLIDPAALDRGRGRPPAPAASARRRPTPTRLHDVLRALGDLTAAEAAGSAASTRCRPSAMLDRARAASGAPCAMRIGGEERWIAAEDAGLYRDALGAVPPGGLPEAFLERRRGAARSGSCAASRARTARSPPRELADRYGVDPGAGAAASSSAPGGLVRGELRPGGSEREWCDPEVLRRLRRASLAALRKEVEPAEQRALARFLPAWQGVDASPPGGAGVDRLREMLVPLQGLALAPEVWERDVLPRRAGAYSPAWIDQLCAGGELVWVGAGALGRGTGKVALYFREDAPLARAARRSRATRPREPLHDAIRERLGARRLRSGPTCWRTSRRRARRAAGGALGSGLGRRGDQRRLRAAAGAAAVAGPAERAARPPVRAAPAARRAAGPGPLVAHRAAVRRTRPQHGPRMRAARRAAARALRHRHARDGAGRGHPRRLRGALRRAGEPRDARHRPPRLLRRGPRRRAVRAAAPRSSGCAACARTSRRARWCWPRPTRPTLRRLAALAEARGRALAAGPRAVPRRVRGDARRRAGALRRARRQGTAGAARPPDDVPRCGRGAGGAGRARAPRTHQAPGASSASTASRWWAPRSSSC